MGDRKRVKQRPGPTGIRTIFHRAKEDYINRIRDLGTTFWRIPGSRDLVPVTGEESRIPLDIAIKLWKTGTQLSRYHRTHVHRWRTLELCGNSDQCLQFILDKINHLLSPTSPCTAMFKIYGIPLSGARKLFLSEKLGYQSRYLHGQEVPPPPGQRITDLSVQFSSRNFGPLTLLSLLSSQHLTTLKLAYTAVLCFNETAYLSHF